MAIITTSTFDPLKTRCNVRLQQGVPIVDADWNELDDIRKFEMRAYLKWYVGDGIPDGSDGFRIDAQSPAAAGDFLIRAGVPAAPPGTPNLVIGLANTGRCIVDGLDVIIPADLGYQAQPLFAAAAAGLPQIQPIPILGGQVAVYIDVWERLVTAQEDPSLVLSGLGTESCARLRREWCVRTRSGTSAPAPGNGDYLSGHSYALLATIQRRLTAPNVAAPIVQADITDNRQRNLSTTALERRIGKLERLLLQPAFVAPGGQIVPAAGTPGQVVRLNGRNLALGTVSVSFGNVAAALSGAPTPTAVNVVVPNLAAGSYSVSISTDGGGPVTAADTFTVLAGGNAPTLTGANPIVPGSATAGQLVTITGTNFDQPGLLVTFNPSVAGPAVTAPTVSVTATQIGLNVPAVGNGLYSVTVSTNAGSVTTANLFLVL